MTSSMRQRPLAVIELTLVMVVEMDGPTVLMARERELLVLSPLLLVFQLNWRKCLRQRR